jgi:type II secretory pathway component PulJ
VAGLRDARSSRVDGDRAVCGEDRHLAHLGLRVGRDEPGQRLLGRLASAEQLEAEQAVAAFGERLRRNGPDAGHGPRHDAAAAKGPRLDRDSELARLGVPGDDRVGQEPLARSEAL